MSRATTAWLLRNGTPEKLIPSSIDLERDLEDWIVADPALLESGMQILARQLQTPTGPLDLLARDASGRLVVVELKRAIAYRDALAQVLDYASWVSVTDPGELRELIRGNRQQRGYAPVDPPDWVEDAGPRMLVAGTDTDDALRRIIDYLTGHGLAVNGVVFDVFESTGSKLLVRSAVLSDETADARRRPGRRGNDEILLAQAEAGGTRAFVDAVRAAWHTATGRNTRAELEHWTLPARHHGGKTAARMWPDDDGKPGGWLEFRIDVLVQDAGQARADVEQIVGDGWFPLSNDDESANLIATIAKLFPMAFSTAGPA